MFKFLLIFLLCCRVVWAESATAPALQEFSSREFRLRFKFPADWAVSTPPAGQLFLAKTSSTEDHPGVLNLRIDHFNQDRSDAAILVDVSDTLAAFIFKNGGQHVRIKPDKLGTLPARRITFQNDSPAGTVESVYIVAIKDRVEYVFNFTAPAAAFESFLPAVNDLLNSFELLD